MAKHPLKNGTSADDENHSNETMLEWPDTFTADENPDAYAAKGEPDLSGFDREVIRDFPDLSGLDRQAILDFPDLSGFEKSVSPEKDPDDEKREESANEFVQPDVGKSKKRDLHGFRGNFIIGFAQIAGVFIAACLVIMLASAGIAAATLGLAANSASQAKEHLEAGDFESAYNDSQSLQSLSESLCFQLDMPQWSVLELVPEFGTDVTNMRLAANEFKDCCTDAVTPIFTTLKMFPLDTILHDDTIDITGATALLNSLEDVMPSLKAVARHAEEIPAFKTLPAQAIAQEFGSRISPYIDLLDAYADFIPAAKIILSRSNASYLLVAQTPTETRSTGGLPGAIGTFSLDNGKITLGSFTDVVGALGRGYPSNIEFSSEEEMLFDEDTHLISAYNYGCNPDFPRVANIWTDLYDEKNETYTEGIISLTPVVVQDVLAITGGIDLSDGTHLDGTNATRFLCHDIYWKYYTGDYDVMDAEYITQGLFEEAASGTFSNLMTNLNSDNIMKFINAIALEMSNRSVLVWTRGSSADRSFTYSSASGALTNNSAEPQLGVFFNIREGSKLGWYADVDTQILGTQLNEDGSMSYRVSTTIHNTLTDEVLESAPKSSYLCNDDGDLDPLIYFFSPIGGTVSDFETTADKDVWFGTYNGHEVAVAQRFTVFPEDTVSYTYTVTTAPGAGDLEIVRNPLLTAYR